MTPVKHTNPWKLSRREAECIAMVIAEGRAQQAADKVGISVRTIEKFLTRVRVKMNVLSTLQAAVLWDRHVRGESKP